MQSTTIVLIRAEPCPNCFGKRVFFLDNQQKGEILQFKRREALQGAGQVSRDQMERKVLREYAAYHARQLKLPEAEE